MKNESKSGGVGCLGVIQIVLIILKLFNLISWSWFQVLIPLWIMLGLIIFVFLVGVIVALLSNS